MSTIILSTHLDLGDELICNGLVREYCKMYDKVAIFCKPSNYPSVSFMFRDLKNLRIISRSRSAGSGQHNGIDEVFAKMFIFLNHFRFGGSKYDEVKIIGFPYLDRNGETFEKQFYQLAGIDFKKKWDSFYVERDLPRERALYEKLNPKTDYMFLHEDVARNYVIDRKKVSDYPVISPGKGVTSNIFDFCTLIEKAKEIHVVDSAFMFLIDLLPYRNPSQKLVVHRYSRPNVAWELPVLKKNWQIVY